MSVPVEYVGSNRGRSYAVDIKVKNLNSGQVTYKTFNQITSLLNCFEIKEIDNKMAEDKVWIITNDDMEIIDVYSNKRLAEMYAEELNEMAVANSFTVKNMTYQTKGEKLDMKNDMKNLDKKDKIELIFTWNNGAVLEKLLNKSYKYVPGKLGVLEFVNENGECIKIDKYGEIIESNESLPQAFKNTVRQRLSKTNKMLNGFM